MKIKKLALASRPPESSGGHGPDETRTPRSDRSSAHNGDAQEALPWKPDLKAALSPFWAWRVANNRLMEAIQ